MNYENEIIYSNVIFEEVKLDDDSGDIYVNKCSSMPFGFLENAAKITYPQAELILSDFLNLGNCNCDNLKNSVLVAKIITFISNYGLLYSHFEVLRNNRKFQGYLYAGNIQEYIKEANKLLSIHDNIQRTRNYLDEIKKINSGDISDNRLIEEVLESCQEYDESITALNAEIAKINFSLGSDFYLPKIHITFPSLKSVIYYQLSRQIGSGIFFKTCACGKVFISKNGKKYCSTNCQTKYKSERYRKKYSQDMNKKLYKKIYQHLQYMRRKNLIESEKLERATLILQEENDKYYENNYYDYIKNIEGTIDMLIEKGVLEKNFKEWMNDILS